MSWALQRRVLIAAIVLSAGALLIGALLFALFHEPPSCTDGVQNQEETGVDCGGSCTYLCTAEVALPVVTFARPLELPNDRVDVIAYVENRDASAAAKGVRFVVELYDERRLLVAEKEIRADLPPQSAGPTPLFIPNFLTGDTVIASAFVEADPASLRWYSVEEDPRLLPQIGSPELTREDEAPRLKVRIQNPHPVALRSLPLIATIFDANGNAIAASRTVIPELSVRGSIDAVFTWNSPFTAPAARTEVRAVPALP